MVIDGGATMVVEAFLDGARQPGAGADAEDARKRARHPTLITVSTILKAT